MRASYMCGDAAETTLKHLKDHEAYLSGYPSEERSPRFECLVCQVFAHILHAPVFDSQGDDPSIQPRVTWHGKCSDMTLAPEGPDGTAYPHDFLILIEATRRFGSKQWTLEFGPCLKHYEDFVKNGSVDEARTYLAFVAPTLHPYTYKSISNSPIEANFLPMELDQLAIILDTSILVLNMKHAHLRRLLNGLLYQLHDSTSLSDFGSRMSDYALRWQKDVLKEERSTFVGIKSYRVIQQVGRRSVAEIDIFQELLRDQTVARYDELIGTPITKKEIGRSLVAHNLASEVRGEMYNDRFLSKIPVADVKAAAERFLDALEETNAQ